VVQSPVRGWAEVRKHNKYGGTGKQEKGARQKDEKPMERWQEERNKKDGPKKRNIS
jgi:hypothetical protein